MSRILVAIDGSPGSEKALEAAVKQAQQQDGKVLAVAVVPPAGDAQPESATGPVEGQARRRLEEILQSAANFARSRGVALTPLLREGPPAEAILDCAEQEAADLLVLGSASGTEPRRGLGQTADRVSENAPCTVLLVK
jgi:nucleotide-binding universal stress UspA family protein